MPSKKPAPSDTTPAATPNRPQKTTSRSKSARPPAVDLRAVYGLFKLSEQEQQIVEALLAEPGSTTVEQLASALKLPVAGLLDLLGPQQLLRAAALVEVPTSAELGNPHPTEPLFLARGLTTFAQRRESMPSQLPGLSILPTPEPDASWAAEFVSDRPAQQVLELVKEKLVSTRPLLLFLSGCGAESTGLLAQAVRLRLSRPVFFLDGGALSGWPLPDLTAALRRLRRDADLRGAALVVQDADLLGAAWRALTHPKPIGQTAPVLLCSGGTLVAPKFAPAASYGNPLQPHSFTLRVGSSPAAASGLATPAAGVADSEPSEADRSREEARRLAALDAARAMGKPIPKELLSPAPAPATSSPSAQVAAPQSPAQATAAPAQSARTAASPEPHQAAAATPPPPKVESAKLDAPQPAAQAPQAAARPTNPRLAAALAKAGLLPPSRVEAAPAPAVSPAPAAAVLPAPAAVTTAPTPAAQVDPPVAAAASIATASESAPTGSDDEADGPPLPLTDDAKLDDLVNIAKATTSMRQRAELLKRLAGTRSPAVIQLFRTFSASPNTAVRLAAEAGMASLFGANWNRARTIAPPVQPPRTDDGGRGPGGAF